MQNAVKLCSLAILPLFLTAQAERHAQPPVGASIRWFVAVEKTLDGRAAGERVALGTQAELRLRMSLSNFEGPAIVGVDSLPDRLAVSLRRDGSPLKVIVDTAFSAPSVGFLDPGETVDVLITVRPADADGFSPGTYEVAIDATPWFQQIKTMGGTPWYGRAKQGDKRRLVIKEVASRTDLAQYNELEGNWRLGARQPREAIPFFEELVRLRPDTKSYAALGAAYFRSGRYADAIDAFERAMPGWLALLERRDFLPKDLATAYLALGRVREAELVLRRLGLSESEIAQQLIQLQRRVPRR